MVTPRSQAGTPRNRRLAAPWYVLLALCGLLLTHAGPESTAAHMSLTPASSAAAAGGHQAASPGGAPTGGHAAHHDRPGGPGHGDGHPHASCALGQPQPAPGPGLPPLSVLPSECRGGATVPAAAPRSLVPAAIGGFVVPIPHAAQSAVLRQ
ncbi:hypothetical protein ACIQUQ_03670 [Streptomyces sp. NPDC101118]|uniref:hypothetical protein n=1 Tax=Streptomyces sp. NPDC101118 TaxID=3366109 RepID=UPI003827C0F4